MDCRVKPGNDLLISGCHTLSVMRVERPRRNLNVMPLRGGATTSASCAGLTRASMMKCHACEPYVTPNFVETHHGLHQNSGLPEFCTISSLQVG